MRAVIQRVSEGTVSVDGTRIAEIGRGLLVLVAVKESDTDHDVAFLTRKILGLRVFNDLDGKMNLSVGDVGGQILVVSQFTLYGDCRKGNRPSFTNAAHPELAEDLYNKFIERARHNLGEDKVKAGIFAAMMQVRIINEGPVTIMVESKDG